MLSFISYTKIGVIKMEIENAQEKAIKSFKEHYNLTLTNDRELLIFKKGFIEGSKWAMEELK